MQIAQVTHNLNIGSLNPSNAFQPLHSPSLVASFQASYLASTVSPSATTSSGSCHSEPEPPKEQPHGSGSGGGGESSGAGKGEDSVSSVSSLSLPLGEQSYLEQPGHFHLQLHQAQSELCANLGGGGVYASRSIDVGHLLSFFRTFWLECYARVTSALKFLKLDKYICLKSLKFFWK